MMRIFSKNTFSYNVLVLLSGAAITQILPFLLSPILTRLYSPHEFGIMGIYLAIVSVIGVISGLRYEVSILIPEDKKDGINLFAFTLIINFVIGISSFLFLVFLYDLLIELLDIPDLQSWLYLIPINILIVGINLTITNWLTRNKRFSLISTGKIIQAIVTLSINLIFGFFGYGVSGLILGWFFGQIAFLIILGAKIIIDDRRYLLSIRKNVMLEQARIYKKFPKINSWHALLNTLSSHLPVIILTGFFNPVLAGYYTLSQRIVLTPIMLFSNSISQVFNQKAAAMEGENKPIYSFLNSLIKKFFITAIVPAIILTYFAPQLFELIFGEEWMISGNIAQLLSPWYLMIFLASPFAFLPQLKGYQRKAFIIEIIYISTRLLALLIGVILDEVFLAILLFGLSGFLVLSYNLSWYLKISKSPEDY